MKIFILLFILLHSTIIMKAQEERFFTQEQAIEWVPQLIAYNMQVIGEQNDQGIKATDKAQIEFLFMTDTKEKALKLKSALQQESIYQLYKLYTLEGFWLITGVTDEMSMKFDTFSKWTVDFVKAGFDHDAKLLNWNFPDEEQAQKIDEFWNWFKANQEEFYQIDFEKIEELEISFDKLDKKLKPLNEHFTFEFSPILDNGKREFVLSADGYRDAFPDLLSLFKRSPELEKWDILPFKQGFDEDPQIQFHNGFTFSWDKVFFQSKQTSEGLSIDFYIEDYDEGDPNFQTGLLILLDSYLGEYDAVMQIRYVDIHKLNPKKKRDLKAFEELKQVVEDYKESKRQN